MTTDNSELLDFADALNTLYSFIHWKMEDADFIPLTEKHNLKLPIADRDKTWYIVNPFKLKIVTKIKLIVEEKNKKQLLAATRLVCAISQSLGEEATFREQLFFCRIFLPPCVFHCGRKYS